jgi:hypothetical protein
VIKEIRGSFISLYALSSTPELYEDLAFLLGDAASAQTSER